ncbi:MAG: YrdB family protein [Actinomycetota bacterium]
MFNDRCGRSEMSGLRVIVLTARFLCELGILASLAFWGFTAVDGAGAWVLGLGAPALAAGIWGTFVSPKARRPLSVPFRVSVEIDLYVLSALALWFAGSLLAAIVLGVLGITTSALNAATERSGSP